MRTIEIRILSQASDSPSPDAKDDSTDIKSDANQDAKKEKKPTSVAYLSAYYLTKNFISEAIGEAQYFYGKYATMSEDYKGQTNVQNAMKTISMASSLTFSALAGAKMGSLAGGLPGAIVGAVAGAAISATKTATSGLHNAADSVAQIRQQAYSNYFYGERAGYADGSQGTEN